MCQITAGPTVSIVGLDGEEKQMALRTVHRAVQVSSSTVKPRAIDIEVITEAERATPRYSVNVMLVREEETFQASAGGAVILDVIHTVVRDLGTSGS